MKKILFIITTIILAVAYANLPPTQLKGGNESKLSTTFNFNLGSIPVSRTGTSVTFGTIPVTQGGTSSTSLTQYSLMSGNGTGAVNMIAPAASGTILFSNGASAFPDYRLLAPGDISTALGYVPAVSGVPWVQSGSNIYYNTGNVGINIASPTAGLHVSGTVLSNNLIQTFLGSGDYSGSGVYPSGAGFFVGQTGSVTGNAAGYAMYSSNASATTQHAYMVAVSTGASFTPAIAFGQQTAASAYTERMRISEAGYLGIGTTSPTTTLDVSGSIRANSLTTGVLQSNASGNISSLSTGASRTVLTSNASGTAEWLTPETNAIVNYASNPSFEQNIVGWTASGTIGTTRSDRSANTVNFLNSDRYYLIIDSASTNEGVCTTNTIPQNMRGSDIEVSTQYRNGFNVSGTWVMTVSAGTTVSQTIVLDAASSTTPYSDSFLSSPKIFVGTTSSTATVQTCFLNSSGSSVLHVDNAWIGSPRSLKTGAVVTPWQSYTPTFTGFGTHTLLGARWRQVGSNIEIDIRFTAGTTTGTEARVSLPLSYVAHSSLVPNQLVGYAARSTTSSQHFGVLAQPSIGYVTFGGVNGGSAGTAGALASAILGTGETATFFASVPVENLQASSTSYDSRCPTDISCANEFSAKMASDGTVSGENLDWISGNCSQGAPGNHTCTFNTGIFTVAPNCTITTNDSSSSFNVINGGTASSLPIITYDSAASGVNSALSISCKKQGVDYKAKQNVEGFMSKTVSTTGNYLERMERGRVGGAATDTTICSSTPCTIHRQSGGVSSVTRSGAGVYILNFPVGTYSAAPSCTTSGRNGVNAIMGYNGAADINSYTFIFTTDAAVAADVSFDYICMGPR